MRGEDDMDQRPLPARGEGGEVVLVGRARAAARSLAAGSTGPSSRCSRAARARRPSHSSSATSASTSSSDSSPLSSWRDSSSPSWNTGLNSGVSAVRACSSCRRRSRSATLVAAAHRPSSAGGARRGLDRGGVGRPLGHIQLPPTHSTASSASQSGAVAWVMPPVGQKRASPNGAGQRLQRRDAARCLGREELEAGKPEVEPAHDVAGIGGAGQERHARCDRGLAERLR